MIDNTDPNALLVAAVIAWIALAVVQRRWIAAKIREAYERRKANK